MRHSSLYTPTNDPVLSTLAPLIGGTINTKTITAHWDEILRLAASIKTGTVTASLMMRKLGAYPRQNGLATALRELGKLERTLFLLDWIQDPNLRRTVTAGLNKGEARNALARAVFFNRLGEIRDRSFEQQRYRASGLNLLTAAIVLWNTVYLDRAITTLNQEGNATDPELLRFLSPLGMGTHQPHRRLHLATHQQDQARQIQAATALPQALASDILLFHKPPQDDPIRNTWAVTSQRVGVDHWWDQITELAPEGGR